MEHIIVELKTINTVFPKVAQVVINGEMVGYICENKEENRETKTQSIVLTNGKLLGDYCCVKHAVKALTRHHLGGDGIYVSPDDMFANMGPLGILLAAALLSEGEEKSPH